MESAICECAGCENGCVCSAPLSISPDPNCCNCCEACVCLKCSCNPNPHPATVCLAVALRQTKPDGYKKPNHFNSRICSIRFISNALILRIPKVRGVILSPLDQGNPVKAFVSFSILNS